MRKRVLMLHTGGTLGMVGGDPSPLMPNPHAEPEELASLDGKSPASAPGPESCGPSSASPLPPREALLERIPELLEVAELEIEILARQDSCDVTAAQWLSWAARIRRAHREGVSGVVIIHGTDTMAYTGSVLSFLLEERPLPVVLTGSQRPLSTVRSDARLNLIDATLLACGPLREVLISFDSLGLRANRVIKTSSNSLHAFDSPGCSPLAELGVEVRYSDHGLATAGASRELALGADVRLSWLVPDLKAPEPWRPERLAVHVLALLGSGNLPLRTGWLETVKAEAEAGVVHVVVSQSPHGGVSARRYQSSDRLADLGAIYLSDLTYIAAVAKARVGLGQGFSKAALCQYLESIVAGERS